MGYRGFRGPGPLYATFLGSLGPMSDFSTCLLLILSMRRRRQTNGATPQRATTHRTSGPHHLSVMVAGRFSVKGGFGHKIPASCSCNCVVRRGQLQLLHGKKRFDDTSLKYVRYFFIFPRIC